MTTELPPTLGLVLAGGLARRMGGGDKALHRDRRRDHPRPRAGAARRRNARGIILNANGDPARFADTGLPVVADNVPDFAGPLAGILAGLDWAAAHAPGHRMASSACRATARSCRAIWSRGCIAARQAAGHAARLRALGRMAASGGRAVAGGAARRPAPGADRGGPAQDRGLDRAPRRRAGRLAGRRRSTRSSTSTRRRMPPRPSALRRSIATH